MTTPDAPLGSSQLGWSGMAFVGGGESNKLWILDARQHKLVTTLDMGGPAVERTDPKRYPNLRDAHAMVFSKDFSVLYTVDSWSYEQAFAIKIDPKTFRELARAPAGEGGHHAALSPDDRFLYVANEYATTVSVIDTAKMEKIKDIEVGLGADYISPSMYWDGKPIASPYLFVSVDKESKVVAIDWRTNEVAKIIPVGGSLHGVNLTPDGTQAWVAVGGAKEAVIIDVQSLSVVKTLPFFQQGGPTHIVFAPDGKYAYITGGGLLFKIDTRTQEVVWKATGSGAHLGVTPDGREVWTLNHTFNQGDRYPYLLGGQPLSAARVFDAATGQFVSEMIAERRPHEIQFVPYAALGVPAVATQSVAVATSARRITLTAVNDTFQPGTLTAKGGEKLQFEIVNKDGYLHIFGSDTAKIETVTVPASATTLVDWTVNAPAGKYLLVCAIHPGMQTDLVVQ